MSDTVIVTEEVPGPAGAASTIPGPTGAQGPSTDPGFSRDSHGAAVIVGAPAIAQVASSLAKARDGMQAAWTALTSDAATTVWTMTDDGTPTVQPGESVDLFVSVRVRRDDGTGRGRFRRGIECENVAGVLTTPAGFPFGDHDYTDALDILSGSSSEIVAVTGPALAVQVTRPAGVACYALVTWSWSRAGAPSATTVQGIIPASGPLAGGTGVIIPGSGFTGATAVTVGGVPLAVGWSVTDDGHIAGATGAGPMVGPADVVVTVGGQNYSLPRAFTYLPAAAPAPLSCTPSSGPISGGQAGVIKATSGCTGTSSVTLATIPVKSFAVIDDQTINFVADSASAVATGDVVVTNNVGPGTLHNGWTYGANPPQFISVSPLFLQAPIPTIFAVSPVYLPHS